MQLLGAVTIGAPRTVSDGMSDIWGSDFAYVCLRDDLRTRSFRTAIQQTVGPRDVVLEVGAGTGILSLFAAAAGARKVFAVEIDDYLCDCLEDTVQANGLSGTIEVLRGDARAIDLPSPVDVVIAELIETGLIDELQVPILNSLFDRGVANAATRFIPEGYQTDVQLMWADQRHYGHVIRAPRHEWPFLSASSDGWTTLAATERSRPARIWTGRFADGPLDPDVRCDVTLPVIPPAPVNSLKLSGRVLLTSTLEVGATNVMNGDKILWLRSEHHTTAATLTISYAMGAGLSSLSADLKEA
jgi:SAM-dependent methyltransferase